MRLTTPFLTTLSLLLTTPATTTARIIGLRAPSSIALSSPFTISLLTENYIQTVYDVSAAFGISPSPGYPSTLGSVIASEYLGPELSNIIVPINFTVTLPEGTQPGVGTLATSVFSLYGASSTPVVEGWNVTVNLGDVLSEETVESRY